MSLNKVDKDIMMLNKVANVNSDVRKLTNILRNLVDAIRTGIDPSHTDVPAEYIDTDGMWLWCFMDENDNVLYGQLADGTIYNFKDNQ